MIVHSKSFEVDILYFLRPMLPQRIRVGDERKKAEQEKEFSQLAKTFALCTAFAANSGGIATLTGTPPNIILKGQADM
jgi:di/tricarboxylate transporter